MQILKLENNVLLVPKLITHESIIVDAVMEIKPTDPDYEGYLQQYENEQKRLNNV